jgi:hypothetical protein
LKAFTIIEAYEKYAHFKHKRKFSLFAGLNAGNDVLANNSKIVSTTI